MSELLSLFDELIDAKMNKKEEVILVMYDLSAAFDTVSPEVLLDKLQVYGWDKPSMSWINSYLKERKQAVAINGKVSEELEISLGTPQGSRLSPLLFLVLMSDLDLCTNKSTLTNFADDTQTCVISDSKEESIKIAQEESQEVIRFFEGVNLVNNADKAALLYNSKGKGEEITVENVGGVRLKSKKSDKLLGLHINSNFEWNTHVDKLLITLKQRLGMLKRISTKIPRPCVSRYLLNLYSIAKSGMELQCMVYILLYIQGPLKNSQNTFFQCQNMA